MCSFLYISSISRRCRGNIFAEKTSKDFKFGKNEVELQKAKSHETLGAYWGTEIVL